MTEIKIKISDLRELCQLVSLEGKDVKGKQIMPISEFLINATEGNLQVEAIDKGNHLAIETSYKATVTVPGIVTIGDVAGFQGFLDRFGSTDEIVLSTTENKIILTRASPKKIAKIPMASPESLEKKDAKIFLDRFKKGLDGYFASSKSNFGVKITVDASAVKSVIDDGEAVHQRVYPWSLKPEGLTVKVGTEQSGEIETDVVVKKLEKIDDNAVNVQTAYAYGIDNVFGNVTGDVIISLINGVGSCPMIVEKSTEKYSLKIVLAPVTIE